MKASEIFKQYIWLLDTIYRSGRISLHELNRHRVKTEMSGGLPLARSTFNRHRESIETIFDLCIECTQQGKEYFYYIENEEVLANNDLQHWMLDSLSISNLLMESGSLKGRILLENIPAGREHLSTIIHAMKQGHKLRLTYHKFGQQEGYTIRIAPYAIKVFKQRWYLVAKNHKRPGPTIYAFDRIVALEETSEPFDFPDDFSIGDFFQHSYGVLHNSRQCPQRIVIRAYYPLVNYLRTLPLHHSQKELKGTPEYADFEYHLAPTFDFRQELLAQGHELEVLRPASLRQKMKEELERAISRYHR